MANPLGLAPSAPSHPPFHFDSRRTRIDWRLLHSVDITQVQARTDLNALDRVVDLVAHGDLEGEDVRNLSEVNFLKIFRLAQMTVEYLLHVQEALKTEKDFYQGRHGEAEARAEVFRLKCKEQREQMGILKRELKHAKKNLKTMELLAEMGKENKEQNAPPQAPQVVYVDSPETQAHVSQLQAEIERLVEQRHHMQGTIAALTRQLEEFEDGGMVAGGTVGDRTPYQAPTPGWGGGASPGPTPPPTAQPPETPASTRARQAAAEAAERRAEEAERCERALQGRLDDLHREIQAGAGREAGLRQQLQDAKAAAPAASAGSASGTALGKELHTERIERQMQNAQANLESTRKELQRLQQENDGLQEERDALAKKNNLLQTDVSNLMGDLEQTQRELREAQQGQGGVGDRLEDDEAGARWEKERDNLRKALAAAEQREAAARREADKADGMTAVEERRLRQTMEQLKSRNGELGKEATELQDENVRLKRIAALGAAEGAKGADSGDGNRRRLAGEVESLQRERQQLLEDLEVARERADGLRDELDESEREVKRLHGLLQQAGVAHEAGLQQAAQEGRRVRHQTEQFESKVTGGSPGSSQRPPAGSSSVSSSPAQGAAAPKPPSPFQEPEDEEDEVADVEEISDWDPDSPFQSLAAPAPVRTRMMGDASASSVPFAPVPQRAAEVLGASVKQGKVKRQRSDTNIAQPAAPASQPAMARRHSASTTGWDAPAAKAVANADRTQRQSSLQRQEVVEDMVEDMVEELSVEDMMPRASGGSFMVAPSEEDEAGGGGAVVGLQEEPDQDEVAAFSDSGSSLAEMSPAAGPQPIVQGPRESPGLPPMPPRSASSPDIKPPSESPAPSTARLLSPREDGDDAQPAGVLAAIEQRLLFWQPVEREYEGGDEERWREYKTKFQDIFRFSSLEPTLKGRLATELLTVEDMDDARAEYMRDVQRALEADMVQYGVDPKQERMADAQFGDVMDEIDRKRMEVDKACTDDQLEHVQFMRDTIRNHLMAAAQLNANPPASTPIGSTQPTPRSSNAPNESEDEEDEDLKALGRFGRPKEEPEEETQRGSGSAAPGSSAHSTPKDAAATQGQPGTPKTEGGASELEMLSSFDASASEGPSPTGARGQQQQQETRDRGPVWSCGHDDDFDSSMESASGGAWGIGRQQQQPGALASRNPRMSGPGSGHSRSISQLSNTFDDDSFDDDVSIEELLE